ncbi:unnamed protein product [Closterium sp. NIES-64]|nr:unnamed protein product [Closterium sp. NIES-64]
MHIGSSPWLHLTIAHRIDVALVHSRSVLSVRVSNILFYYFVTFASSPRSPSVPHTHSPPSLTLPRSNEHAPSPPVSFAQSPLSRTLASQGCGLQIPSVAHAHSVPAARTLFRHPRPRPSRRPRSLASHRLRAIVPSPTLTHFRRPRSLPSPALTPFPSPTLTPFPSPSRNPSVAHAHPRSSHTLTPARRTRPIPFVPRSLLPVAHALSLPSGMGWTRGGGVGASRRAESGAPRHRGRHHFCPTPFRPNPFPPHPFPPHPIPPHPIPPHPIPPHPIPPHPIPPQPSLPHPISSPPLSASLHSGQPEARATAAAVLVLQCGALLCCAQLREMRCSALLWGSAVLCCALLDAHPSSPLPILSSPHPLLSPSSPLPILSSPHPLLSPSSPHPIVSSPHPLLSHPLLSPSSPLPILSSPHPLLSPSSPLPILSSPHPLLSPSSPLPILSSPHPLLSPSSPLPSSPLPILSSPILSSPILSSPHPLLSHPRRA